MYYVDFYSLFNNPEKDWENMKISDESPPIQLTLFWPEGACNYKKRISTALNQRLRPYFYALSIFIGQQWLKIENDSVNLDYQ